MRRPGTIGPRWAAVWWAAVILAIGFAACDDTIIDPFRNEGRIFTVYGFLDQTERDHAVRVVPVARTPERIESTTDRRAEIDARVFSTNLETGDRLQWTHDLVQLASGRYGHVFRANFAVAPATTYLLEIERSDGSVTSAETTLPFTADPSLLELGPLVFNADSTIIQQDVTVPLVNNFWEIRARYLFESDDDGVLLPVHYGRRGSPTEGGGWTVTFDYTSDMVVARDSLNELIERGILPNTDYGLTMVGIQIRLLDDAWEIPPGEIDVDDLAQPGRLSNVENGYGFWGSVATFRNDWDVASEFSQQLGNPF